MNNYLKGIQVPLAKTATCHNATLPANKIVVSLAFRFKYYLRCLEQIRIHSNGVRIMYRYEEDDLTRIANIIRAGRKAETKTQHELASIVGVSQGTISKFEAGTLMPSALQWYRICHYLNLFSEETFLTGLIDREIPFTNTPLLEVKSKKKQIRGNAHTTKVREILPFLAYMEEKLGVDETIKYVKTKNVDPDFFLVLDNQITITFLLDLIDHFQNKFWRHTQDSIDTIAAMSSGPQYHGLLSKTYNKCPTQRKKIECLAKKMDLYEQNFHYHVNAMNDNDVHLEISKTEALLHDLPSTYGESINLLFNYKKYFFQHFINYPLKDLSDKKTQKQKDFKLQINLVA